MSILYRALSAAVPCCLVALSQVSVAQEELARESSGSAVEGEVYFGGMAAYRDTDSRGADSGASISLFYGAAKNEKWNHEWVISGSKYDADSATSDAYRFSFGWDALYFIDREGIQPYILGGVGLSHNDIPNGSGGDETGLYANAGLGFLTQPVTFANLDLSIRGDVRMVKDSGIGDTDIVYGLGVQLPLSRVMPAPLVSKTGDGDTDGVPDNADKCPGTQIGLKVDELGCAIPQVFVLKGIYFEPDSSRLGVNAQTILGDTVNAMLGQKTMRVEIAGHTDNAGPSDYNRRLSQRRAEAVKDYLVKQGVDPDRLRANGYGEDEPVASNDNDFGRQQNRRVEFRIEAQ